MALKASACYDMCMFTIAAYRKKYIGAGISGAVMHKPYALSVRLSSVMCDMYVLSVDSRLQLRQYDIYDY